jgi:hypothetical protein
MRNEINEIQDNLMTDEILVFLQEKRTALAAIRIGISTVMAQISILGVLIITSKYYDRMEVLHLLIPFTVLNIAVFGIAGYFIVRSIIQMHILDREIRKCRKRRNAGTLGI